jgi:YD repeat-containing protein
MTKTIGLACLFFAASISTTSNAQVTADIAQGQTPYGVYQMGDIDSVNAVNGNVSLRIPLLSYPQRGKDLRMDFYIYSNDKQWTIGNFQDVLQANGSSYWEGQWSGPVVQNEPTQPMVGAYVARDQDVIFGQDKSSQTYSVGESYSEYAVTTNFYGQYVMEANGAKHYIGDYETQICQPVGGSATCPVTWSNYGATYPATDGTNWTGEADPNGILHTPVSSSTTTETDPNGNQIVTSGSGWTDSIGRSLPGSQLGPGAQYQTNVPGITVPGVLLTQGIGSCPSDTVAARKWVVPAHNSTTETYYLCYSNFTYQTAFDVDSVLNTTLYAVAEVSSSSQGYSPALLLSAVVLPNGTSYTFSYDQYLSLTSVTLPTGGTISYTWQNIPFFQSSGTSTPISRAVATRTLNPGNGQPSQTWTYHWYLTFSTSTLGGVNIPSLTYPVWSIVTDPAGNDEEHQLGGTDDSGTNYLQLVDTKVQSYAGCGPHDVAPQVTGYTGASGLACSQSGGALLQTVSYILSQYGSGGANVNTPAFLSNQLLKPTTTTTTLPTLSSNLVRKTVIIPTPKYGSCQLYYDLNLQPQPGVTNPSPQYQTISPCYSTNQTQTTTYYDFRVNAPGSALRTDTTQYLWQDTSLGPNYLAANLINLVETQSTGFATTTYAYDQSGSPQGARGNLTSVTRTNSSGASPTTQTVYNSQGLPILLTDANGNKTSIAYQCSGAFPQQVIKPYQSSTTLPETTSYVYDCNTGLIASMTDPNQKTTSYTYSDPLNRLTKSQYPDGGSLQYQYNDTESPVNVTAAQAITSSTTKQIEYDVDGLGRLIHVKLSDPAGGVDETDTNYDALGRIASVWNPYHSTSDPTYGVTTYTYDALGRKISQTQQDGNTLQWCYNGIVAQGQTNCAANMGSETHPVNLTAYPWVDYSDETGRHWQQISDGLRRLAAAIEPNSSNVRFWETDYQYDALSNLLRVDQWGGANGSSGDRARTFTYDGLSQLLSVTNPESGATGFSYDANGNVLSKTDARGVTINYIYDALNRLTAKSYTNDPSGTPSSCFQYDKATTNGVGRIANQWTQKGTCPALGSVPTSGVLTQRSILAYDQVGRVTSEQQCILSNCTTGTTPYPLAYTYDLAGDITSYLNGVNSIEFTNAYDSAGRLSAITTTYGVDAALFSAPSYNSAGSLTGATYGTGLTLSRTYDKRFRVTSETDTGSVVPSPTSGSATVTITGSEQIQ